MVLESEYFLSLSIHEKYAAVNIFIFLIYESGEEAEFSLLNWIVTTKIAFLRQF